MIEPEVKLPQSHYPLEICHIAIENGMIFAFPMGALKMTSS